jgi:hypothetical protein
MENTNNLQHQKTKDSKPIRRLKMSSSQKSSDRVRVRINFGLARASGTVLIILGTLSLASSIFFISTILAFVGLGLVFWGIVLVYVQSTEYVKRTVLAATAASMEATLDQTLLELNCRGKAVYLPPKYLNNPENTKAYVLRQRTGELPSPEQIQRLEAHSLSGGSVGMIITPPGAELARLFEDTLQTGFTQMNLSQLQGHLPRLLIEDLEIASDVEMQTGTSRTTTYPLDSTAAQTAIEGDGIFVKITSTTYKNAARRTTHLSDTYTTLGSPLTSAIACAITKVSGKPVIIENEQVSEDGETTEIEYRVLEEEQL